MDLLKNATRRLLLQKPTLLSIPKQGYKIDDNYISVIDFIKDNCKIQQRDYQHMLKLIEDKTVLKRYFSDEIIKEFDYLPFIELGIEFLLEHCELENAQKGKIILENHIHNLLKKD